MSDNSRLDGIDERLYHIEKQCADLQQQIIGLKRIRATASASDHLSLHLTAEWRGRSYHVTSEISSTEMIGSSHLLCQVLLDSINRMRDECIKQLWNAHD